MGKKSCMQSWCYEHDIVKSLLSEWEQALILTNDEKLCRSNSRKY